MTLNKDLLMTLSSQISLVFILIINTTIVNAGIYKWVDEAGNTHYSQVRPQNTTSKKMQVQKSAPGNTSTYKRPTTVSEQKNIDDENAANNPEPAQPEKKPETRAEKKKRLAACEKTRANLKTMVEVGRIRAKDKDGNMRFLSQPEKEAKMEKNRRQIAKHCK